MKILFGVSLIANVYMLRLLLRRETPDTSDRIAFAAHQLVSRGEQLADNQRRVFLRRQ
jgi:hypothetical protein